MPAQSSRYAELPCYVAQLRGHELEPYDWKDGDQLHVLDADGVVGSRASRYFCYNSRNGAFTWIDADYVSFEE